MMKRITALILTVVFLLAMSTVAFAAEADIEKEKAGSRATSTNASFTLTDDDGNQYHIFGYCYPVSVKAAAYTSFTIKKYANNTEAGRQILNNTYKEISAGGSYILANPYFPIGGFSFGGGYVRLNGATNSTVSMSSDETAYVEGVESILADHRFRYNGAEDSRPSQYYAD